MWGGAAAIGASGFAFMATNVTPASSAGQGAGPVSGYVVSGIQYSAEQGWGNPLPDYTVSTVKFILTSVATQAPGNGQPSQVNATLEGLTGVPLGNQTTASCSTTSWSVNGSGQGSGAYVCPGSGAIQGGVLVSQIYNLDVEANN